MLILLLVHGYEFYTHDSSLLNSPGAEIHKTMYNRKQQ